MNEKSVVANLNSEIWNELQKPPAKQSFASAFSTPACMLKG